MKLKTIVTKPFFLIFISAIFSALPLTFSNLFFISWVSFVPMIYVILKNSGDKLSRVLLRGFLFGFVYHVCIYYWFLWFYPLDFTNLTDASSVAVVCLAWLGISLVHGILWCLPTLLGFIVQKFNKHPLLLAFTTIVGIIAAQKLTMLGELSFPWVRISLGQYVAPVLIQSASLFGAEGVDFLILFINASIALCIIYPPKKRLLTAMMALVVFAANLSFGIIRLNTTNKTSDITVMTVQASVQQTEKWSSEGDEIAYSAYSSLTKENITQDVDLILWPESAIPTVYQNENSLNDYKNLSKELDTPLLSGVLLEGKTANTNSSALFDGEILVGIYSKRQLVPFGEYMPYETTLDKVFPFLKNLNIIEDKYIGGSDSAIIDSSVGKIGNVICFENIYPALSRQSVLDGAEIMVEATNDSWLKDSPAMSQHLAHAVFRSVETDRCLIRSANSGISAIIDSRGNVIKQLGINESGVIVGNVYLNDNVTLYTKTGDFLFWISIILLTIISICSIIKNLKKKSC